VVYSKSINLLFEVEEWLEVLDSECSLQDKRFFDEKKPQRLFQDLKHKPLTST
jgi:hypothetical protein